MSTDFAARGLALQAKPIATLATEIGAQAVPQAVKAFHTGGYGSAGKGMGTYVSDNAATSTLAAAHPRFCKQSADGRYWRLSVEDGLNVLQAGALADNTADDGPVFLAALSYLKALALEGAAIGYGKGAPRLRIPKGNYYLGTTTLDIDFTLIVEGDNGGGGSGGGTTLRWADNATGMRTQSYNTSGASADAGETGLGAVGTIIRNLYLKGGFTGTESESHGIQLRCPARLENLIVDSFGGDGIFGKAGVGSGMFRGQTNGSSFYNVAVIQCRNGFFFDLADSNALNFFNCVANSNRRYGAWHATGISVNWFGGDFSTNGSTAGFVTKCSYGYRWYYCLPGQETGAAANPPKGAAVTISIASPGVVTWTAHGLANGAGVRFATTGALPTGLTAGTDYYVVNAAANTFQVSATSGGAAINTSGSQSGAHTCGAAVNTAYWGYMLGAGDVRTEFPAWTNGMAIRAGGSFRADGTGQQGKLYDVYVEGDQPWPMAEGIWSSDYTILNAFTGERHGAYTTYSTAGVEVPNGQLAGNYLKSRRDAYIGPTDGAGIVYDPILHIGTSNAYATVQFDYNGANYAQLQYFHGGGFYYDLTSGGHSYNFRVAGALVLNIGTAGVLVSYAGAKLGYATGAGGAVTQSTSRTTGVTLNKACGQITLVSAAGSATWQSFTVTNSAVEAGDVIQVSQKSGTDKYMIHVTAVAAGSFQITFATTVGTTTEQPVFSFAVGKAVAA